MRAATAFFLPLLLLQLALTLGCTSTVPATVTMGPAGPLETPAKIFLTAARQPERIAQSLRDAGLEVVSHWNSANYALQVDVGSSRGSGRECGSVNNVAYILSRAGVRYMVIKGRGMTGSCTPNVFDDIMGRRELMADRIHPNGRGYEIMAEHFERAVRPYL